MSAVSIPPPLVLGAALAAVFAAVVVLKLYVLVWYGVVTAGLAGVVVVCCAVTGCGGAYV